MKLRGGNVFLKLEPHENGWRVAMEYWLTEQRLGSAIRKTREVMLDSEPTYDSFVVTVGELIAELAGEEA